MHSGLERQLHILHYISESFQKYIGCSSKNWSTLTKNYTSKRTHQLPVPYKYKYLSKLFTAAHYNQSDSMLTMSYNKLRLGLQAVGHMAIFH